MARRTAGVPVLQLTVRAILALAVSTAVAVAVIYVIAARSDGVNVVSSLFAISILLWTPAIVALLLAERSANPVAINVLTRCDRFAASLVGLVRGNDRDA